MLRLHRVAADDEVAQVVDAGHRSSRFSFEGGFAPAHDALIGFELYEHIWAVRTRDLLVQSDAENLHPRNPELGPNLLEYLGTRGNRRCRREGAFAAASEIAPSATQSPAGCAQSAQSSQEIAPSHILSSL